MDETEVEEGEDCYYRGNNQNIDPDIAFSYLDEKLQKVLGHLLRDFEGEPTPQTLGAKFGGYGSFLPTYERSAPIRPCPKNPKEAIKSETPNLLHVEGASQYRTAPSDIAQFTNNSASHGLPSSHSSMVPAVNISNKKGSHLSSASGKKFLVKEESVLNKQTNLFDQRTLKVRIKMNPESIPKDKTAIYHGFGLATTPSSSNGNSPEESSGVPSQCHKTPYKSPSNILQIMTSFPVPGGSLLSPLIESMLCLEMKEKLPQSSNIVKDSRKLSKEKKKREVAKRKNLVVSKGEISRDLGDGRTIALKREVDVKVETTESEPQNQGSYFFGEKNQKPLSTKVCDGLPPPVRKKAQGNISGKKIEVTENRMENKLSLGLVEGESLQSISDHIDNSEQRDLLSGDMEKTSESEKTRNYGREDSVDSRGILRSKRNKKHILSKGDFDVSNCSGDPLGQKAVVHENDDIVLPHGVEKSSIKCRKKSRIQNSGDLASEAEGSLISRPYEVPKGKRNSDMIQNSRSHSDIQMVNGSCGGLQSETMGDQVMNQLYIEPERPSSNRVTNSNHEAVRRKQRVSSNKSREISTQKSSDLRVKSDVSLKESANDDHTSLQVGIVSEPIPAAPTVIQDHWVQCELCQKWRLLPFGTMPDQLPDKWMCSMLNWLPGKNHCNVPEDETTQALHALYVSAAPESHSNLEINVDRNISGATSTGGSHLDMNHLNPDSHYMPTPQQKKQKLQEPNHAASNGGLLQISATVKNSQQDAVKCRSLNDMNQNSSGLNLMSNSHVQHLSKSHKYRSEKSTPKHGEKQQNRGDTKEKKIKSKRAAEQYEDEISKRTRVDVAYGAVEHHSRGDVLSARGGRKLLQPESSEMKSCSESEISLKKMRLKNCQESQDYRGASRSNSNYLRESKVFVKEESSENELKKVKKSLISDNEVKESAFSQRDEKVNITGKANLKIPIKIPFKAEACNPKKGLQARKPKTKGPTSGGVEILKRDSGSEQFPRAATSSSSKVSDSYKVRSNFQELKGSPVESVSSSPIHTSNADEFSPARRKISRKNASKNSRIIMTELAKKSLNGEGNITTSQERRLKASGVSHSESQVSVLDFRDSNNSQMFSGRFGSRVDSPCKYESGHLPKTMESPCPSDLQLSDHCPSEDKMNKNVKHDTALLREKSKKSSSLLLKGKEGSSSIQSERIEVKETIRPNELVGDAKKSTRDEVKMGQNHVLLHGEPRGLKYRIKLVKDERDGKPTTGTHQKNQNKGDEASKRSDLTLVDSRGGCSSQAMSDHVVEKDPAPCGPPSIPHLPNGNALGLVPFDSSSNGDSLDMVKQCKDASSLQRNDASIQASAALKEAEKLKVYADRLKGSGFVLESIEAHFQAVLKFLHASSLLENPDFNKLEETSPIKIYSSTAKLCEVCANDYERHGEMAVAALAYKCMEVAYMRVVYCKNSTLSRDRHVLQASLQMVPQGESPSSSASDVDSINNQAVADKAILSKGIGSHAGNHVIVARNHPNFVRLLDFTKDVNSAMEASYKSQNAFAAAKIALEEAQNKEGIVSLKRVIDLSFQDMDELVRLVRTAYDTISRQGFTGNKD